MGALFWYDTDFSEFDPVDIIDYILEKSVSYQKKDGCGHAHPSFFGYDNDKNLKVCFLVTHVMWLSSPVTVMDLNWCTITWDN